jgi:hypothetical protein
VAVAEAVVESAPLTVKMYGLVMLEPESPETVSVLVLGMVVEFKAIFDGLKEQVPGAQDRAMVSVKVLREEEREIVKVVVVVPTGRDCVRVGEVRL